jgi:hypothetical protein
MKDVKKQLEKLLVSSIVVRVAVDGPLQDKSLVPFLFSCGYVNYCP